MGPFDNETRKYVHLPEYEDGVWLEDSSGSLYIIPVGDSDIEGPDGFTFDQLNVLCRRYGEVPKWALADLGLSTVPGVLKRFDEERGYYHA